MIRMECSRELATKENVQSGKVEIITNFSGCSVGRVIHYADCPNIGEAGKRDAHKNGCNYTHETGYTQNNCHPKCRDVEPIYIQKSFEGCILDTYEQNGYDDSDFLAHVWNESTQSVISVCYASTRGWTYANGADVDATPEVVEKANNYYRLQALENWKKNNEKQAKTPAKGKTLLVYKGRKTPKGTTGLCFWYGQGKVYGYGQPPMRVGMKDSADTTYWVDADNVEVIGWEQYLKEETTFDYCPPYTLKIA